MRGLRLYLKDDNNTYDDKVRFIENYNNIPAKSLQWWAVDCAESVLYIFENNYPNNNCLRNCIDTTKAYLLGNATREELKAARLISYKYTSNIDLYAARAANSAYYASRSAVYTHSYTINYSTRAASYAAYVDSAYQYRVSNSTVNKVKQQELNIQLLLNRLTRKVKDTKLARKMFIGYKVLDTGELEIEL